MRPFARFASIIIAFVIATVAWHQPDARAQSPAATSRPAEASDGPPIRLAVIIVVDQLRADLITRYEPLFGDDGFRRLLRHGAHFRNAYLSYGSSATAPGHSTIATGRLPRQHGITGNRWFLDATPGKAAAAIDDPDCDLVGTGKAAPTTRPARGNGKSSHALIGAALGDQLKLADARSRVVSIAWKDRAAILMGGRKPDWAVWFDHYNGRFVTSSYYAAALPKAVDQFDAGRTVDRFAGQTWDRLLPGAAYDRCWSIDPARITDDDGIGNRFPHELPGGKGKIDKRYYDALCASPYANTVVVDLVTQVLQQEQLGRGAAPDLLCVGLSANDLVGHIFGPDSPEMLDITVRTDREIARLLDALDQAVGLDRCAIVLTGDHGASTPPALTTLAGIGGGYLNMPTLATELNSRLDRWVNGPGAGALGGGSPFGADEPIVSGFELPWVYFNRKVLMLEPAKRNAILAEAAAYLKTVPGIDDAITAEVMEGPMPAREEVGKWLAWRGYHPGRSGEIYLQLAPHWHKTPDKLSGHSASYSHDRHVPIVLSGPGVKPGVYFQPADLMDIAPTLAALLGIEAPPDALGRVLGEAMESATKP